MLDKVLLPGTGFVELALQAGLHLGCRTLDELTLQAPLVLPAHGDVQLQVAVGGPDDSGRRPVTVYSRPGQDRTWTRHATGTLSPGGETATADRAVWPPADATPVDLTGVYAEMSTRGYAYGPVFQGLRAAWRRGDEVFAEVVLPETAESDAGRCGVHPALLDAALHGAGLGRFVTEPGRPHLPFAWTGVTLHAVGATTLRVVLSPAGPDAISLLAMDGTGAPVLTADSLVLRPVSEGGLGGAHDDSLFRVNWTELTLDTSDSSNTSNTSDEVAFPAVESAAQLTGLAAPQLVHGAVVFGLSTTETTGGTAEEGPEDVYAFTSHVLEVAQAWLADDRFGDARLVVMTRGAVATTPGEDPRSLAAAAVWGLIRTAQTENPGRFVLVDTVDEDPSALPAVLATDEPQVAIRAGRALVPRLVRAAPSALPVPAQTDTWRLRTGAQETLENLAIAPCAEASRPLAADEIRVAVHAAGVNFRDVLLALGMYPDKAGLLGSEAAGTVLEIGSGVAGVAPGDRVMGLFSGAFGPVAITDHRLVAPIPEGWSFPQAAATPIAFLTAMYALIDLAEVRSGESVLVHAAAGGVGMAAVQVARWLGAEVFATASPAKWAAVRACGSPAADRVLPHDRVRGPLPLRHTGRCGHRTQLADRRTPQRVARTAAPRWTADRAGQDRPPGRRCGHGAPRCVVPGLRAARRRSGPYRPTAHRTALPVPAGRVHPAATARPGRTAGERCLPPPLSGAPHRQAGPHHSATGLRRHRADHRGHRDTGRSGGSPSGAGARSDGTGAGRASR
ncbi:polyketide synthase dehydratase domain-containing protein (plasmid) [Streptomyces rapamycinicus]